MADSRQKIVMPDGFVAETPLQKLNRLQGAEREEYINFLERNGLIAPRLDNPFVEAGQAAAQSFVGSLRGLGATVNELTGDSRLQDYFQGVLDRNQQWNEAEDGSIGSYIGRAVGGAAGSTAGTLAAATAGSLLGGPKVGLAAGIATAFSQSFGENVQRNRAAGYSEGKAYGMAFLESGVDSVIENLPMGIVGKSGKVIAQAGRINAISKAGKRELLNLVGKKIAAATGQKEAQNALLRMGKSMLASGGGEGLEEGLQYLNSYVNQAVGGDPNANISLEELADNIARGFIGGFFLGGVQNTPMLFTSGKRGNALNSPDTLETMETAGQMQDLQTPQAPQLFDTLVSEVGNALGIKIDFMDTLDNGAELQQKTNGMYDKSNKTLYLNRNTYSVNPSETLGHELKHYIDDNMPELSKAFNTLLEAGKNDAGRQKVAEIMREFGIDEAQGNAEFSADMFGKLFARPDTWQKMAAYLDNKTPGMGEKFLQTLKDFYALVKTQLEKLVGVNPEAETYLNNVEALQNEAARMLAELRRRNGTASQVENVVGAKGNTHVESVPVSQINVDAQRFQFKSNTSKVSGVDDFLLRFAPQIRAIVSKNAIKSRGDQYNDDLLSEAYMAAAKAYENYDPAKGASLDTAASTYVDNALKDFNRKQHREFKRTGMVSLNQTNEEGAELIDNVADEKASAVSEEKSKDLLGDYQRWKSSLKRPVDRKILDYSEQGLPPSEIARKAGIGMTADGVKTRLKELAVAARTEGELLFSRKRGEFVVEVALPDQSDSSRKITDWLEDAVNGDTDVDFYGGKLADIYDNWDNLDGGTRREYLENSYAEEIRDAESDDRLNNDGALADAYSEAFDSIEEIISGVLDENDLVLDGSKVNAAGNSFYLKFEAPNGEYYTLRFSDHKQPAVGSFRQNDLGGSRSVADVDIVLTDGKFDLAPAVEFIRRVAGGDETVDNGNERDLTGDDKAFPERTENEYTAVRNVLRSIQGNVLNNEDTGIKAKLSSTGVNKMLSNKARNKSKNNGFEDAEHLQAAANIDRLFANAVLTEDRPDKNNDPNIVSIKRFSAPFYTGRGFAEARLTVKESIEHGNRIYSLELDEIKKPSSPNKGGLDKQANTPALDGYNKLIQKIKNASAKIKNNLEKDDLQFSRKRIFTGSAASYDKPSLQYVGTGEGAQVYGWGLYGSESEKVARWYAEQDADRKNYASSAVIKYMGTPYTEQELFDYAQTGDADLKMLAHIFSQGGVQNAISELEQQIKMAKQKNWEPELYEWQEDLLKDIKEAQDDIEYLGNSLEGKRHLYNQTFWPNKNEDLLDWNDALTDEQREKILKQADKEGVFKYDLINLRRNALDALKDIHKELPYDDKTSSFFYKKLAILLGSPKAASEFLYRAGIDGVTYIGDSSGARNYVAFSDQDIQIDEHIQYSRKRLHEQINPIVRDGVVRDEYADLLEKRKYDVQTLVELQNKALEWITRKGGAIPAAEAILKDQSPANPAVAEIARRLVLESNDVRVHVSRADRTKLYELEQNVREDWGRTGRAMQLAVLSLKDIASVQAVLNRLHKHLAQGDVLKLRNQIKDKLDIDIFDLPEDIVKDKSKLDAVLREHLIHTSSLSDKFYEYYINAILSGPTTHLSNLLGNTANAVYELGIKRFTEALFNIVSGRKSGASFGEFRQMVKAMNWSNAAAAAKMAFDREVLDPAGKFLENNNVAIGGKTGRIIRIPGRALKAADAFAKALIEPMETAAYAFRLGVSQGLSGSDLSRFIQKQLTDVDSEAYRWGKERGKELTFQEDPGAMVNRLMALRESDGVMGTALKLFLPFIKTPYNILRQGIRKGPLGTLNLAAEYGKLALGKRKFDDQLVARTAEQLLAWGAFMTFYALSDDDDLPVLTGSSSAYGSAEYGFKANKIPPYSIRLGNTWYSYQRVEPLATGLAAIADGIQTIRDIGNGKDATQAIKGVIGSAIKVAGEKSFLDGIGEIIKIYQDPERNIMRPATNLISSAMPALIRQSRQAFIEEVGDSKSRNQGAEWWKDQFNLIINRAGITAAIPKIDYFGRDVKKDDWSNSWLSDVGRFLPIKRFEVDRNMDKAERLIWNYNRKNPNEEYYPSIPRGTFSRNGVKMYFAGEDYREFAAQAGQLAHKQINNAIHAGRLNVDNPSADDIKLIQKIFNRARKETQEKMLNRSKKM